MAADDYEETMNRTNALIREAVEPPRNVDQLHVWRKDLRYGDWVFYAFELGRIVPSCDIGDARLIDFGQPVKSITVTNGRMSTGLGNNRRECLFPLTLRNKILSEHFKKHYDSLHELPGNIALNFPDLHQLFERVWGELCSISLEDELTHDQWNWARTTAEHIKETLAQVRSVPQIHGVSLFH
jgi:hypothetical protein